MTRSDVHGLVDSFPDAELDRVAGLLDAYRKRDRGLISALLAPQVDEDEMAWINSVLDEPDPNEGQYVPFSEVLKELQITEDDIRSVDLAEYERANREDAR